MASIFDEPYASLYNNFPRKEVKPGQKQVADFHFVKTIGEGSFAAVLKVKEKETDREFAMKIMEKRQVQRENITARVMRERDIMLALDHPFILKLYCTFQTDSHLFFGLSLAENGCLLDYLLKYGSFSIPVSRFYTAELVHAVDYMHSKDFIHRDIKPENILLDGNMHTLITDFGVAGKVSESKPRRNSFVGTAQYVAPELLGTTDSENKYTCKESDLWAVGCVLYQFLTGTFPFPGPHDYAIFQLIRKCEYKFEEGFPTTERDFIQQLLVVEPEKRLGSYLNGGISQLKAHEIFADVDWENLAKTQPPPMAPYLPPSESDNGSVTEVLDFDRMEITVPKKLVDNRQSLLSAQAQNFPLLHKHLNGNELVVKEGLIHKRRGLSRKKRHLVLTDYPSLYYIDPSSQMLKGEVPWEEGLEVQLKGKKHFHLHTPHRIYYMESCNGDASDWKSKIEEVKKIVKERPKT